MPTRYSELDPGCAIRFQTLGPNLRHEDTSIGFVTCLQLKTPSSSELSRPEKHGDLFPNSMRSPKNPPHAWTSQVDQLSKLFSLLGSILGGTTDFYRGTAYKSESRSYSEDCLLSRYHPGNDRRMTPRILPKTTSPSTKYVAGAPRKLLSRQQR